MKRFCLYILPLLLTGCATVTLMPVRSNPSQQIAYTSEGTAGIVDEYPASLGVFCILRQSEALVQADITMLNLGDKPIRGPITMTLKDSYGRTMPFLPSEVLWFYVIGQREQARQWVSDTLTRPPDYYTYSSYTWGTYGSGRLSAYTYGRVTPRHDPWVTAGSLLGAVIVAAEAERMKQQIMNHYVRPWDLEPGKQVQTFAVFYNVGLLPPYTLEVSFEPYQRFSFQFTLSR